MRKMNRKLTKRQVEVARGILAGQSNQEIADGFGIALHTVECHAYRVFRKLDIHSRWQLLKLALDAGMLEFTPKYEREDEWTLH